MSGTGNGRRGRRGGRRQRKREEQQRAQRAAETGAAATLAGTGAPGTAPVAATTPVVPPIALVAATHPPPLSARALVARLEALRLAVGGADHDQDHDHDHEDEHAHRPGESAGADDADTRAHSNAAAPAPPAPALPPAPAPAPRRVVEPRRFTFEGVEWIARLAGSGTGGTGHVAIGRIEAIRFALATEPDSVAAEVLVPRARLDEMYDDELIEMLDNGLRAGKRNG